MRLGRETGADARDAAVGLGIRGVPVNAADLVRDGVEETLAPLRMRGLEVCQVGAFGQDPLSDDSDARATRTKMPETVLPVAPETGCPYVVICGGSHHPSGFGAWDPRDAAAGVLDAAARRLDLLATLAAKHGAKISIEPYLKTAADGHAPVANMDVTSHSDFCDFADPAPAGAPSARAMPAPTARATSSRSACPTASTSTWGWPPGQQPARPGGGPAGDGAAHDRGRLADLGARVGRRRGAAGRDPPAPPSPRPPTRMTLDTDTFDEIDDRFALVHALLSPEAVTVEAIHAAPFANACAATPGEGMEPSHAEILRLPDRMDMSPDGLVHKGVRDHVGPSKAPRDAPAVGDLIARPRASDPVDPLHMVAIAAISNVASALQKAPDIADRIVVVWLGGHALYRRHARVRPAPGRRRRAGPA